MAEVVNLRQARKRRDRAERSAAADANRALHGRSNAERDAGAAERSRQDRALDGAKRDD